MEKNVIYEKNVTYAVSLHAFLNEMPGAKPGDPARVPVCASQEFVARIERQRNAGSGAPISLQAFVERPPPDFIRATGCHLWQATSLTKNVIYANGVIYGAGSNLAYPGPRALSAIARSGVQRENRRAAARYLFLKNWIPDLRGGFASACPGHEAEHRHL